MNRNIDLSYELNTDSRIATIILNETYIYIYIMWL